MCVSTDNKTCVLTGLPLVKHTIHGRFCSHNCGLVEAIVRDEMSREVADNKAIMFRFLESEDQHEDGAFTCDDTEPAVSGTALRAANLFIDKIHRWIETVVESTDFD